MKREFLRVNVSGVSTPKGCRKPRRYLEILTDLDNESQIDEAVLCKLAREYVAKKNKVETCRVTIHKASEDGYNGEHPAMVFVAIQPFKTFLVTL